MTSDLNPAPKGARKQFPRMVAIVASLALFAAVAMPLEREQLPEPAHFAGRLHPLLLHLPIGFLVAVAVLEVLNKLRRSRNLDAACTALLWLSALVAVPTVLAGTLLATEGGYPDETLGRHRWLGGATAILILWLVVLRPRPAQRTTGRGLAYGGLLLATLVGLTLTSHFGATLTHGSDYLTEYASWLRSDPEAGPGGTAEQEPVSPAAAFDELNVFTHLVQPLLKERCTRCHGPKRHKKGLRLDSFAALMAGSENGPVLVPGNLQESTMAELLLLPKDDDRHMPPESKPQPTADEIEVLLWWIGQGAPEDASIGSLTVSPRMEESLRAVLGRPATDAVEPDDQPGRDGKPSTGEPGPEEPPGDDPPAAVAAFHRDIRPVLQEFCFRCHGPDKQKGDMRLDRLDPDMVAGGDGGGWHTALDMINGAEMPPDDEPQLSDGQRRAVVAWLTDSLRVAAIAHQGERRTILRRLNRDQYSHTLADLLGLGIDFGRVLPADGMSKMGFTNNGEVLQASPLHLDYYQAVARQALEQAIAVGPKPEPIRYRVTFGKGIGVGRPSARTGGYQAVPLNPDDFAVDILDGQGRVKVGADAAEQKALDRIKRKVTVGLRGSSQDRFRVVDEGMLLFSALPHREKVPKSWQGPSPNLKLEMQRCFPEVGDFVMRVVASRGYIPPVQDQLLVSLDDPVPLAALGDSGELVVPDGALVAPAAKSDQRQNLRLDGEALLPVDVPESSTARVRFDVPRDGFYQIDLVHPVLPTDAMASVRLTAHGHNLDLRPELTEEQLKRQRVVTPLGAAGLRAGRQHFKIGGPFFTGFTHMVVTPLPEDHPLVVRLTARSEELTAALAGKVPAIRSLIGTRTDDGMDYKTFDAPQEVHAALGKPEIYTFHGRLENLPIPEPESGDNEVLSGILLLGLWNDHLVKSRDQTGPPLLVESIEFEAPYHPVWPPKSHSAIFFESPNRGDEEVYTREVLARFMERAFRRPLRDGEVERTMAFWRDIEDDYPVYEHGVREVLVAVLCSPNFLFLVEPADAVAEQQSLPDAALASRLSYFLWNSPPDGALVALAGRGQLRAELAAQVHRMLEDPKAWRFVRGFAREWLRLDRLEGMTINVDAHPAFTRFVKRDMAEETYHFVHEVLGKDLSIFTLIDSDFAMLNQNLAEFYGIAGVRGPHFRPVPITPGQRRGGLLSQGAFLSGHSDGTHPHPIKRAVWLKEKILGDPPPAPPPNVPDLDPDTPGFDKMTLKQQLEAHRDNASCVDCHRGIDPYGLVFEGYSAVGRYEEERRGLAIDARSVLPDGTAIEGVDELKAWIRSQKPDVFAASLIEHLFAYALGRDIHFADDEELARILERVKSDGYRMRSVILAIVSSPSFTKP